PIARLPDGPDGTIMFGVNLLRAEAIRFSGNRPTPLVTDVGVHVIIAHEFAHILQYKKGLSPNGSWHMELHADYMAGWFIGSTFDRARDPSQSDVDVAARSMFTMGDWAFNKPEHHGHGELRAAMVRAGFSDRYLHPDEAFEKGRWITNLD